MATRTRRSLSLVLFALVVLFGASEALSGLKYKIYAPAGVSVHEVGEFTLQVTTSDDVQIYIVVENGEISGSVEPVGNSAVVRVVVLNEDGEEGDVVFQGRVRRLTPFDSLRPHETGQGEQ